MNIPSVKSDALFKIITPHLKTISVGDILVAEVLEVVDSKNVLLLIKSSDALKRSLTVTAKAEMELSKGDVLQLKVTELGQEIKLRLLDSSKVEEGSFIKQIRGILSELANLKGTNDLKMIKEFIKSMPEGVVAKFPEFRAFERLLPEITQIDHSNLKTLISSSGVMFEARLKLAVLNDLNIRELIMSDLKGLLLKVKYLLMDEEVLKFIQMSTFKHKEIMGTVERILKNIEYFQLSSYLNDIFYTLLPISWEGLRNGEIIFKKGNEDKDGSFICEINIDLERIGRLSTVITLFNKAIYITFYVEKVETVFLMNTQKGILEKNFKDLGLILKGLNIIHKEPINFGVFGRREISLKG